jgi:ABC-2 type transport system permease protein
MMRAFAIAERELLKFFRSPRLMLSSMAIPLLQLVVLGAAFAGKIHNASFGIVDHDRGAAARKVREALLSIEANAKTIRTVKYDDEPQARQDLYAGALDAAIIIPPRFSSDVLRGRQPEIGLLLDNSDIFLSDSLAIMMQQVVLSLNGPSKEDRLASAIALQDIELYPYIEYMKYLLPGSIALAMFVAIMISGGLLYVDDKAKGVHEGYLVTPITKIELIAGLNIASMTKAVLSGLSITLIGSLLAGLDAALHLRTALELFLMIAAASICLSGFMFLLVARVEDPLLPRTLFTVFITLLYFPSGAVYPVQAFPDWLRAFAVVDPFTYVVHGFRSILLKDSGVGSIVRDAGVLAAFGVTCLLLSIPLFKRTL